MNDKGWKRSIFELTLLLLLRQQIFYLAIGTISFFSYGVIERGLLTLTETCLQTYVGEYKSNNFYFSGFLLRNADPDFQYIYKCFDFGFTSQHAHHQSALSKHRYTPTSGTDCTFSSM